MRALEPKDRETLEAYLIRLYKKHQATTDREDEEFMKSLAAVLEKKKRGKEELAAAAVANTAFVSLDADVEVARTGS